MDMSKGIGRWGTTLIAIVIIYLLISTLKIMGMGS